MVPNVMSRYCLDLIRYRYRIDCTCTTRSEKQWPHLYSMMGPSTHGILDSTNFAMTAAELCIRGDDHYL